MPSNRKRPLPLAPKPSMMKSRKKARQVTTQFHKLTRQRDQALLDGNDGQAQECNKLLEAMGGREEYQRASQLSTSFHSTSKWVLGKLAQKGWLHGITIVQDDDDDNNNNEEEEEEEGEGKTNELRKRQRRKRKRRRRPTRLLEVGAINTELLDKAAEQRKKLDGRGEVSKYKLQVRAIDIHSMEERIEEADFLKIPFISPNAHERYDVIVCSMVSELRYNTRR